jgi:hypothetical protein
MFTQNHQRGIAGQNHGDAENGQGHDRKNNRDRAQASKEVG